EHVQESLRIMNENHELSGKEKNIYPVIRATSFPLEMKTGDKLVYKDHTAETRIFYELDLGKSYRLIDETMLEKEGWTTERIRSEHVQESLRIMNENHELSGKEKNIYPVIRATSFPLEMKTGDKLVYKDHTAETRIFYALDLGKSYRLIDETMLEKEGWTKERI